MNDSELETEYKLIVAKLRNEQETREYGGKTALDFAHYCCRQSTIARLQNLHAEAELIMDIMDAALAQHMQG